MTHRGPFQPLPFCDSVTLQLTALQSGEALLIIAKSEVSFAYK